MEDLEIENCLDYETFLQTNKEEEEILCSGTRKGNRYEFSITKRSLNGNLLYIPIIFEGNPDVYFFLIDSGSQHSIIRKGLYKKLNQKGKFIEEVNMISMAGETKSISMRQLKFKTYSCLTSKVPSFENKMAIITSNSFETATNILNIKIEGLLGMDFLQKYGFNIDFEKKVLSCKCS